MKTNEPEGLGRLLRYSLMDAMRNRRSRRFSLGATLPGGALAYRSQQRPVPLSPLEEALLSFAAAGITGFCLAELPYQSGGEKEAGGGNVMAALTGRTGASADAIHGTSLFIINDEGTYMLKRPQDFPLVELDALAQLARVGDYETLYQHLRVKVRDGRTTIPREVPAMLPFNQWSTNLPGTTYFLPVSDLSGMYINILLSAFDEQIAVFMVDERNNFKPAGLKRFGRKHGGHLWDDPKDNRVVPINFLETITVEFLLAEQAFMGHNLSLMEQAMGLGGWTHFATATEVSWLEALGFKLGTQKISQALHAGFLKLILRQFRKKDLEIPYPLGLTVEGKDLIKPFCPPYYHSMEEAVRAFLDFKKNNFSKAPLTKDGLGPWKDPEVVQASIPDFSKECIDATIAYCSYIYNTYGRFPAYFGPLRTTLAHQAHHLDLEFYDKFYQPGAYTETQGNHMEQWH
jgi:hypothetical protein